jgi:UDP-N-acetylmuramate--L-alanine ligase/UDP-N-acetylenolpyruvoylglucosamine reductase
MSAFEQESTLTERLRQRNSRVHCAGVCGIGMAGLAALLQARGLRVSGCDAKPNALADWLRARGIDVAAGHAPDHVAGDTAWVVRSAAVPAEVPEIQAALTRGLPVWRRGEVLPALLTGRLSIAVAGTHGKTTTTGFIAQMLRAAGRDPSFCIGGEVPALGGVAAAGRDEVIVVEADESDGTLTLYRPDIAVVTNIDFDHMEHFADVAAFEACFARFIAQAGRRVIYCGDDPRARRLAGAADQGRSYGFGAEADVRAVEAQLDAAGSRFRLALSGQDLGEVRLSVPGAHNILNALAAAAVGLELGLPFATVQAALARAELPRRRFESVVARPEVAVIADYAHHPSEVAALVRAARGLGRRRILAVFQPHRYTRTLALGADFPAAFQGVAELVLTPVYAASEPPLPGGTSWDLYAHFRRAALLETFAAASLAQAWDYLKRRLAAGDLLLIVGAGDIEQLASRARAEIGGRPLAEVDPAAAWRRAAQALPLHQTVMRFREPLAPKTTLGVGGAADIWAEVGSAEDLAALAQWCAADGIPLRIMGGGSNLLVDDLGVRGVVARLTGAGFQRLEIDGPTMVAGAGAPLAALLRWCAESGFGGLEFLEGIPGTVGGAVRMNAGAWGGQIGDRVRWVRGLNRDGAPFRLAASALAFGYRECAALADRIVLAVGLELAPAATAESEKKRAEIAARREWLRGLRSAGSIFKNPPGDAAGRLIEAAGLKGCALGGAAISTRHANVIVAESGARAGDVRALLEKTRIDVERRFGVKLQTEIVLWD